VPDPNSFRISKGKATLTTVNLAEIARILGVRRNSPELRRRFEKAYKRMEGEHSCVLPAYLFFVAEHERIRAEFREDSAKLVATIFWHAYAKVDGTVEVLGSPEQIERMWRYTGCHCVLASQLTGNPSRHRFAYLSADGSIRTASDQAALDKIEHNPAAVIDLEAIARRVSAVVQRPLITLRLRERSRADNVNAPELTAA
jgi:hypothetical protein